MNANNSRYERLGTPDFTGFPALLNKLFKQEQKNMCKTGVRKNKQTNKPRAREKKIG